jgi:peroxiredoxin
MRKLLVTVLSTLLLHSFINAQDKQVYKDDYIVKTGDQAPDFKINEAGGRSFKLSDLRGKVVMFSMQAGDALH